MEGVTALRLRSRHIASVPLIGIPRPAIRVTLGVAQRASPATIQAICQAGQNALSGAQHTELVAVGIGHDHPIDIALADVDSSRPESEPGTRSFIDDPLGHQ